MIRKNVRKEKRKNGPLKFWKVYLFLDVSPVK